MGGLIGVGKFIAYQVITSTIDCNQKVETEIIASSKWENAPKTGIAILRTYKYSSDWIVQEFVPINSEGTIYIRKWYEGTTWTKWFQFTGV